MTSAVKPPLSLPVAVRHTPFTATQSPIFKSDNTSSAPMDSTAEWAPLRMERMVPISSTIPVNIQIHLAFQ